MHRLEDATEPIIMVGTKLTSEVYYCRGCGADANVSQWMHIECHGDDLDVEVLLRQTGRNTTPFNLGRLR